MGLGAAAATVATALGVTGTIGGISAATVIGAGTVLAATAGAGILAAKAMGGKSSGMLAAPAPIPAPAPMPVLDQTAVAKNTQTQAALASATSGRQSTVLSQTGTSDKLGG